MGRFKYKIHVDISDEGYEYFTGNSAMTDIKALQTLLEKMKIAGNIKLKMIWENTN